MNSPSGDAMLCDSERLSLGDAVEIVARRLAFAGILDSRREARLLVALALGLEAGSVFGYPERPLDRAMQAKVAGLASRRASREPFSRIAGRRQFWSLDFAISRDTLDPRPESETLVEAALELLPDRAAPLRLLDLGTGSGCLLLALLSELANASGVGIDILPGAAAMARRNAAALGLADRAFFVAGNWGGALSYKADVILANPPYVPGADLETLMPEVARYDPRRALEGGTDGLESYRELAGAIRPLLKPGGIAVFEVGSGQAAAVTGLLAQKGLVLRRMRRDLAGIARCVVVAAAKA